MPICITCSTPVKNLYTTYSKADDRSLGKGVRLTQCPNCKRFADKYVEHDYVVLFIDLVLIKPQVYRHLLFNRLWTPNDAIDPSIIRLGILLILFDVYITWARIERLNSTSSITSADSSSSNSPSRSTVFSNAPIITQYLFFLTLNVVATAVQHGVVRVLARLLVKPSVDAGSVGGHADNGVEHVGIGPSSPRSPFKSSGDYQHSRAGSSPSKLKNVGTSIFGPAGKGIDRAVAAAVAATNTANVSMTESVTVAPAAETQANTSPSTGTMSTNTNDKIEIHTNNQTNDVIESPKTRPQLPPHNNATNISSSSSASATAPDPKLVLLHQQQQHNTATQLRPRPFPSSTTTTTTTKNSPASSSAISTALLVSSCTKLFPILLVIWPTGTLTNDDDDDNNNNNITSSSSSPTTTTTDTTPFAHRATSYIGWIVLLNNIEALLILLECGYVKATTLAVAGLVSRWFVEGWLLGLVGLVRELEGPVGDVVSIVKWGLG